MDIRYPVLQAIGIEGKDYVKILNEVGSPNATKALLEEMFRSGITSSRPQANTNIELTDKGVCLLSQLQNLADQERRDHAEREKNKAAQKKQAIIQIAVNVLLFVLGVIAEAVFKFF